jgi:hypothetical protein
MFALAAAAGIEGGMGLEVLPAAPREAGDIALVEEWPLEGDDVDPMWDAEARGRAARVQSHIRTYAPAREETNKLLKAGKEQVDPGLALLACVLCGRRDYYPEEAADCNNNSTRRSGIGANHFIEISAYDWLREPLAREEVFPRRAGESDARYDHRWAWYAIVASRWYDPGTETWYRVHGALMQRNNAGDWVGFACDVCLEAIEKGEVPQFSVAPWGPACVRCDRLGFCFACVRNHVPVICNCQHRDVSHHWTAYVALSCSCGRPGVACCQTRGG